MLLVKVYLKSEYVSWLRIQEYIKVLSPVTENTEILGSERVGYMAT